jgi:hypothetical protein
MFALSYTQMVLEAAVFAIVHGILGSQFTQLAFKCILAATGQAAFAFSSGHILAKPKLNFSEVSFRCMQIQSRHFTSGDTLHVSIVFDIDILQIAFTAIVRFARRRNRLAIEILNY